MFSFLEYRSLWETSSSFASKRAVVENMNYGVSGGWQQHVRSGHLSGDRREIRVFLLPACWSQRYCVWYGCGFVVRLQGPVNSDPHFRKYKARNSFFFFFFKVGSEWLSVLFNFMGILLPRCVEMVDLQYSEFGFHLLQLGGTRTLFFHWYFLEFTFLWFSSSRSICSLKQILGWCCFSSRAFVLVKSQSLCLPEAGELWLGDMTAHTDICTPCIVLAVGGRCIIIPNQSRKFNTGSFLTQFSCL